MKKEKKEKTVRTAEQKKELKKNISTGVFAAVAVIAIIAVISFYVSIRGGTNEPTVIKPEVTSLEDIVLSDKLVSVPYVQTDFDSVVYTANSAGEIQFFEFNGSDYVELAQTGSIAIQVPLSNQQIPVTIYYIERDGKITGYGVFTSNGNSGVYIYDFILCKITNLPQAYEQVGKCLLLVNTEMSKVYSNEPVWEEAYVLNLSNAQTTRFLSENNRMLDVNGAVRSDFCMITTAELLSTTSSIPFFSSRGYELSDNTPYDIYIKHGNRETLAASSVADKYTKPLDDGGFVYIKKTNSGFSTMKYLNGQETAITMFYSEYGGEYMRSGDWLLCKEDGRIYSTYSDTIIEAPNFKINPMAFAVSDDGKYIVMAGTVVNALDYQIYIYNTETGKAESFSDNDYSTHYNLYFSSASTICYYTISTDGYRNVIIDLSKIQ